MSESALVTRTPKMPTKRNLLLSPADSQLLCPAEMGERVPAEVYKLIVVIVFLVIAGFTNWIALAYIHDFVGRIPLSDVVFTFIPQQSWALRLGDLMVTFCASIMILLILVHKHRAIVIRRVLFIIACLYYMRTISLLCTQLPSGYVDNAQRCREQLNQSQRTFGVYFKRFLEQTIRIGFQDVESKQLCGDLLFSGHTLIMVISSLTVQYYSPYCLRMLQYVPKLFMYIGMICMILSRTHYTMDVVFAYWLSVGVFSIYHSFCEIDIYRDRKNSVLSQIVIMRFAGWLEKNVVPGKLENSIDVPFSRLIGRCFPGRTREMNISGSASTVVIDPV